MREVFEHADVALIRELIRHCRWRKIDWRKLFLAGAFILSLAAVLLPTFFLSYYWNIRFPSLINDSPHQSLNGNLSKNLTEAAGLGKLQLVPNTPFASLNSSSFEAEEKSRVRRRRKRRRRSKADDGPKLVPPPPRKTVSPRLQVEISESVSCSMYAKVADIDNC